MAEKINIEKSKCMTCVCAQTIKMKRFSPMTGTVKTETRVFCKDRGRVIDTSDWEVLECDCYELFEKKSAPPEPS